MRSLTGLFNRNLSLIWRLKRFINFFDGLIIRTFLLVLCFISFKISIFKAMSHPRKVNSSFSRLRILDFFSEIFRPCLDKKEIILGICVLTNFSLQGLVTIKSSAYLITQLPISFLPSLLLGEGKPFQQHFLIRLEQYYAIMEKGYLFEGSLPSEKF